MISTVQLGNRSAMAWLMRCSSSLSSAFSCFVEDQRVRLSQQCAGQTEALTLAAREAVPLLADPGFVTFG